MHMWMNIVLALIIIIIVLLLMALLLLLAIQVIDLGSSGKRVGKIKDDVAAEPISPGSCSRAEGRKVWHDSPMPKRRAPRRLADTYTFPGFRPQQTVQGIFGDPQARLIRLTRRGKKTLCGLC